MRIHALNTGKVRLKHSFLYASAGWRRQPDLFLPGAWSEPMPIHCWLVEHADRLFLIDAGETAGAANLPFARFEMTTEDELPAELARVGHSPDDLDTVVLTHLHGDHMDGCVHVSGTVLVHDEELAFARTLGARVMQRLFRQPIPSGVAFRGLTLDGGPFGGFARSRALSDDGRIVAVSTPGHTPGHISVICVDDAGRHVMLAGDTTDSVEQLHALRPDAVSPKPAVTVDSMRMILDHAARQPTVYLPAHDPESVRRLEDATTL